MHYMLFLFYFFIDILDENFDVLTNYCLYLINYKQYFMKFYKSNHRECSVKKRFLKDTQMQIWKSNLQENTHAEV